MPVMQFLVDAELLLLIGWLRLLSVGPVEYGHMAVRAAVVGSDELLLRL
jgi:uncharacterized protein with PIN domain